jgi:hypothetical protein
MADPSLALWIYRAAEAEGLADVMSDPTAKRMMLMVAVAYRRLAEHAAAQQRRTDGDLGSRDAAGETYPSRAAPPAEV